MELFKRAYRTPIGIVSICSTLNHILEISFQDKSFSKEFDPKECIAPINKAIAWLNDYFQGNDPDIACLPIQLSGTEFQRKIWDRLCRIPFGETITYGEIAKEIAKDKNIKKMSSQAVGQAVRKNPICIVIPCHRVIGSNRQLTGYSGGLEKKKLLLEHEAKYKKARPK